MGLKTKVVLGAVIIAAIIIGMLLWNGMRTVATGEVGIVLEWNNAKSQVNSGLHIINPITQSIVVMDIKTQKIDATASAATNDLQNVQVDLAVNYKLDPAKTFDLFKQVGLDYNNRLTTPGVQEVVKQVTAKFKAQQLITMREDVRNQIQDILELRLAPYGIMVTQVSITNVDFAPEFDKVIEETAQSKQKEQLATNNLAVTKIEAQTQIVQADAKQNATIALAEGEKAANILRAEGESEAIQLITSTLLNNSEYIDYLQSMRWNGQLPLFGNGPMGGGMDLIFTPEILNMLNSTSTANSTLGQITLPQSIIPGKTQGGVVINSK